MNERVVCSASVSGIDDFAVFRCLRPWSFTPWPLLRLVLPDFGQRLEQLLDVVHDVRARVGGGMNEGEHWNSFSMLSTM